jgi:hypothetical protein
MKPEKHEALIFPQRLMRKDGAAVVAYDETDILRYVFHDGTLDTHSRVNETNPIHLRPAFNTVANYAVVALVESLP